MADAGPVVDSRDFVFGILGLAMPIIGGGFWLVWRQISDTARNLREEMQGVREYTEERSREGRDDRAALWSELRNTERTAVTNYREVLDRISKVPTREELRDELRIFESRIARVVGGDQPKSH